MDPCRFLWRNLELAKKKDPNNPSEQALKQKVLQEQAGDLQHTRTTAVDSPARDARRKAEAGQLMAYKHINPVHRRPARFLASLVALGTVTFGVAAFESPANAGTVSGAIRGRVFRDFNSDGVQALRIDNSSAEPLANWLTEGEPGISGISVFAYDVNDAFVGEALSTANGDYVLNVVNAETTAVRLEVGIPDDLAYLTFARKRWNASGTGGGADVAFVTVGATGANFNLINPTDFCQANPRVATNCFRYGDQRSTSPRPTLQSWWLNDLTPAVGPQDPLKDLALENQIGTTFGLAYNRATDTLFASAYLRRYAGFGPGGTGAIYAIKNPYGDPSGPADQQPRVSLYADLNALLGAGTTGLDPHPGIGSGPSGRMSNPPTATELAWFKDPASYTLVGKMSLGGMALSEDMRTLFVVNMNTDDVYKMSAILPPASASDITRQIVPTAGCFQDAVLPGAPPVVDPPRPTITTPTTTTTVPTTTTTVSAPPANTRTVTSQGGAIDVGWTDRRFTLLATRPSANWTVVASEVAPDGSTVWVRFQRNDDDDDQWDIRVRFSEQGRFQSIVEQPDDDEGRVFVEPAIRLGGRGRSVGMLLSRDPVCDNNIGREDQLGGDADRGSQTCAPGDSHPMAIAVRDGKGYLGVTCSAESTQDRDQMRAYVYRFDPKTMVMEPVPVVDVGFSEWRICNRNMMATARYGSYASAYCADQQWMPWTNQSPIVPPRGTFPANGPVDQNLEGVWWGRFPLPADNDQYFHTSPILATITFNAGDLVLGIRNRSADQLGPALGVPDLSQTTNGVTVDTTTSKVTQGDSARGELVAACMTASGVYAVERGELVNTTPWTTATMQTRSMCASRRAFRHTDNWGRGDANGQNFEMWYGGAWRTMGVAEMLPGSRDLIATAIDPAGAGESNGTIRFSGRHGSTTSGGNFQVYVDRAHTGGGSHYDDGLFAKSNGLGDLEILCDQAPTEIGDRVWLDTNGDGVQSPDTTTEPGLGGVRVNLLNSDGALLAAVATAADGSFVFSSGPNPMPAFGLAANATEPASLDGTVNRVYNIAALKGFRPSLRLEIDPTTLPPQPSGTQLRATTSLIDLATGSGPTHRTSKMYDTFVSFPIDLSAGRSRHDFDLGVSAVGIPPVEPVSYAIGDEVFLDLDNSGDRGASEPGAAGAVVTLFEQNGDPAIDVNGWSVSSQTVTASGRYLFAELPAGNYQIRVTLPPSAVGFANPSVSAPHAVNGDSDVDPTTGHSPTIVLDDSTATDITDAQRSDYGADRLKFSKKLLASVDAGIRIPDERTPPT